MSAWCSFEDLQEIGVADLGGNVTERTEWPWCRQGVAGSNEHGDALFLRIAGGHIGEGALSDARLTADEQRATRGPLTQPSAARQWRQQALPVRAARWPRLDQPRAQTAPAGAGRTTTRSHGRARIAVVFIRLALPQDPSDGRGDWPEPSWTHRAYLPRKVRPGLRISDYQLGDRSARAARRRCRQSPISRDIRLRCRERSQWRPRHDSNVRPSA